MFSLKITEELILNKELESVHIQMGIDTEFILIKCKILSCFRLDNTLILKLKPVTNYAFGHEVIYRSINEII